MSRRAWLSELTSARWAGYAVTVVAIAAVSGVIWAVFGRTHIGNTSMFYLAAVLALAIAFGRGPAILAAVIAFLANDFLFTEPYYTLTVARPEEWLSLVIFLATAVVTGQLAAAQRARAEEARQRERETHLLYGILLSQALEHTRLQQEATEADVLRRTDELRTALLNAVSHDLRTPLASIITSAGSLRQEDILWTAQERAEFAETIEHEAGRLNHIIGNLLDLSRIEAGSLRPEKAWYDLGALVDDVLGRLRPVLEQHTVTVNLPEDLPPVLVDYVEIDQVLTNLLENAAKYAPPGSGVCITARIEQDAVLVTVADSGAGIPTPALPHVFEPFYRANGNGPKPRGTGLGLAVAKGLVEAHGGHIWAENRSDGGARFVFRLPANLS